MALETISTLFSAFSTAANTTRAFTEILTGRKGEARLLLEELKKNLTLSWLVVRREVEPQKIIPQLSTKYYDQLLQKGFNFNNLSPKKKKIAGNENLESSDLAAFVGKDVAHLVEGIYDRIKEVQVIFQVDPLNKHIDWNRRILNLHKRILLLMWHLRGRMD